MCVHLLSDSKQKTNNHSIITHFLAYLPTHQVFTTEEFMSLKGVPSLHLATTSSTMTKEGEQDSSGSDAMVQEESVTTAAAVTSRSSSSSQSVTSAGQSVWTIGK